MFFDDLLHLRLLLWRQLQIAAEAIGHAIGGETGRVAGEEAALVNQIEMIAGHADQEAGYEGDDDHHHGRRAGVTRH
jgi:hypothetical protein